MDWQYEELLRCFRDKSRDILGDNLTGIYLHGSAAMGCFNPEQSDLDLILVVETEITDSVKREFMKMVVQMNEKAPAKGIELSVVRKEFCNPFVYPTPFELHFSVTHLAWLRENPEDYIEKMKGTDKDLAAHFTIIREYGIPLYGAGIEEIFGRVPAKDYIDSIWCDIQGACEDIMENPVYMILNLCRVLAYLKEEKVLSKKAGGEWGIKNLPVEFQGLIQKALGSYVGDQRRENVSGYPMLSGNSDEQSGTEWEKCDWNLKSRTDTVMSPDESAETGNTCKMEDAKCLLRFAQYMIGRIECMKQHALTGK